MAIMADEIMEHIRAEAAHLNIDLSSVDWNSVKLPPNSDFGIKRYLHTCYMGCLLCSTFEFLCYLFCIYYFSDDDDDDFNEEESLEVPDQWTPPEINPYTPEVAT